MGRVNENKGRGPDRHHHKSRNKKPLERRKKAGKKRISYRPKKRSSAKGARKIRPAWVQMRAQRVNSRAEKSKGIGEVSRTTEKVRMAIPEKEKKTSGVGGGEKTKTARIGLWGKRMDRRQVVCTERERRKSMLQWSPDYLQHLGTTKQLLCGGGREKRNWGNTRRVCKKKKKKIPARKAEVQLLSGIGGGETPASKAWSRSDSQHQRGAATGKKSVTLA